MRIVSIDRDDIQCRVLLADRSASGIIINDAFSISLEGTEEEKQQALIDGLKQRGVGRTDTIFGVERSDAELQTLELPNAPDDELPSLVRFQGLREFSQLTEDAPLDFYRIEPLSGEDSVKVLAAAVPSSLVKEINTICEAADLRTSRAILRPTALARLLQRMTGSNDIQLMVDVLADHANLSVVRGDMIVFTRSVRLSQHADLEQQCRSLLSEVRRTLAASANQLEGERVQRIVIWGNDEQPNTLTNLLRDKLEIPVEQLDPFAIVEARTVLPPNASHFAAAIALLDSADGGDHILDFLNPRKEAAPPDNRRLYAIAGIGAAAILLLIAGFLWWQMSDLDSQISSLEARSLELDEDVSFAQTKVEELEELEQWQAQGANWLEEMHSMMSKLPEHEKLKISKFTAMTSVDGGGRITMGAVVDEPKSVTLAERNLQDDWHTVTNKGWQPNPDERRYPWKVDEIRVEIRDPSAPKKTTRRRRRR